MRLRVFLDNPLLIVGGLVLAIVVLVGVSASYIAEMSLLPVMVLIGAASRVPQRFAGGDIGIELCMFFMVCTVLGMGLGAGLLVGIGGMLLSGFFTKEPPQDLAVALLGFGVAGFLVNVLGMWASILTLGVVYTVLYDLLTGGVYLFMGHSSFGVAKFALTHIVWNFVIFRAFGAWLLTIL